MSQQLQDQVMAPKPPRESKKSSAGARISGLTELPRRLVQWFKGLTPTQRLRGAIAAVATLIILVAAVLAWYLILRKPITELPGLNVAVPPGYSYSISDVQRPIGVAVDNANARVYVSQTDGDRSVRVFDVEGNSLGSLKPPTGGTVHMPTYMAVDQNSGELYVSDRGANQVYVYDAKGQYLRTILPKGVTSWGPLGVAVDGNGVLYVADANASPQRVWAIKSDGTVLRTYGEGNSLSFPNGLAVLDDGTLFIADSNRVRVLVFNADGSLRGSLAKGTADAALGMPRGLAVGAGGRLYVVDTTNSVVRVYGPDRSGIPVYLTMFGENGQLDGQFAWPNGVAADDHGRIFVTDRANNRLQVWTNR